MDTVLNPDLLSLGLISSSSLHGFVLALILLVFLKGKRIQFNFPLPHLKIFYLQLEEQDMNICSAKIVLPSQFPVKLTWHSCSYKGGEKFQKKVHLLLILVGFKHFLEIQSEAVHNPKSSCAAKSSRQRWIVWETKVRLKSWMTTRECLAEWQLTQISFYYKALFIYKQVKGEINVHRNKNIYFVLGSETIQGERDLQTEVLLDTSVLLCVCVCVCGFHPSPLPTGIQTCVNEANREGKS